MDVESLPALTSRSHRTIVALLADLDEVRKRGYAIDDEETAPGVVCYAVALPARSAGSDPHAASVSLLKARADEERRGALVADLIRLSGMMGHPLRPTAGPGQ